MEIYIVGPTASGKSDLAIQIAKILNTEIISADSMQIYKELNIGTAKIKKNEMMGIQHHMIDLISYKDDFSVSEFSDKAKEIIKELKLKNKIPIIVGGTGLYVHSLLYNMNFGKTVKNIELRAKIERLINKYSLEKVYRILQIIDYTASLKINKNDKKRIIRALEINLETKKNISSLTDNYCLDREIIMIFINPSDRALLYEKINLRVDKMFQDGLLEEIKQIDNFEYQSMKAIGYREFNKVNITNITEEEITAVKTQIKQDTRRYAKRQITWFKQYQFAKQFDLNQNHKIINYITEKLNDFNK